MTVDQADTVINLLRGIMCATVTSAIALIVALLVGSGKS